MLDIFFVDKLVYGGLALAGGMAYFSSNNSQGSQPSEPIDDADSRSDYAKFFPTGVGGSVASTLFNPTTVLIIVVLVVMIIYFFKRRKQSQRLHYY